ITCTFVNDDDAPSLLLQKTVVTDNGVGHDMERIFDERSIQAWETTLDLADGTRRTFALEANDGLAGAAILSLGPLSRADSSAV
ncbi:MAG: hypothetical protein ACNYZH_04935, partial [Acidimicrobiia bacterium]